MIDVLIVDDDDIFGELTEERLELDGVDSRFHHGPFGTVNEVIRLSPKIVILDVNMPGLQGTSLIEMLRKGGAAMPPKILLMSSCDDAKLQALAAQFQADDCLSKSADRVELLAKIRSLLAVSSR